MTDNSDKSLEEWAKDRPKSAAEIAAFGEAAVSYPEFECWRAARKNASNQSGGTFERRPARVKLEKRA